MHVMKKYIIEAKRNNAMRRGHLRDCVGSPLYGAVNSLQFWDCETERHAYPPEAKIMIGGQKVWEMRKNFFVNYAEKR